MEKKEILVTKDYDLFKILAGNRNIAPTRVNRIKKSIKDVGYITSPILVNENMEIIDGQGRYTALRELNLPIEYIVQEGLNIRHCISMNINQTNWSIMDFIKSYAERGLKSYILLIKTLEKYPDIPGTNTFATAFSGVSRFDSIMIKSGDLLITDEQYEKAIERLNYVNDIAIKYKKNTQTANVVQGLLYCTFIEGVDLGKLKERITAELNTEKRLGFAGMDDVMQYLERIYNRNNSKLVFIYTEYRKIVYSRLRHLHRKNVKTYNDKKKQRLIEDMNTLEE